MAVAFQARRQIKIQVRQGVQEAQEEEAVVSRLASHLVPPVALNIAPNMAYIWKCTEVAEAPNRHLTDWHKAGVAAEAAADD